MRGIMNWRKLLVVLVVLPLIAYGGAKGFLWYFVNSKAEELQRAMAPVAKMNYAKVHTPLTGPIGIGGITIRPHMIDDTIRIRSVLLYPDGPQELYSLMRDWFAERMPKRLKLGVNRITVPLDGEIVTMLESQSSGDNNMPVNFACGGRDQFNSSDLQQMGYEDLATDIKVEYQFRRGADLNLFTSMHTRDMMTLTVEANIPAGDVSPSLSHMQASIPSLANLSFSYQDDSYQARKRDYCASLAGIEVADYVEANVQGMAHFLGEQGFQPSEELLRSYRKFLTGTPKITINFNPYEPIDMTGLAMAGGGFSMDSLGMEVLVDQQPITLRGVVLEEDEPDRAEAPKIPPDTFKATTLAELPQHINRRVRIATQDGKHHSAFLESVGQNQLVLTRHLVGGSATYAIPVAQISEIFVLR